MFDLVQSSLDNDITLETFDELLQDMIEVSAVKLRTIRERECLSLPKEETKDLDMTANRTINDLATFRLQLDNFKSSLEEDFNSFKQSFIAEVLSFKNDFLQKQATNTDGNTTEKLFQQMEKYIFFLHDELKSKSTVINILLETLIRYKDEIRNIHSNHDIGNIPPEKKTKTAKSVETKKREIASGEKLQVILNKGNHPNNTIPQK